MGDLGKFSKEYFRKHHHLRRKKIIDYLGGKCVQCGSTEKLEVDHIDPSTKSHSISKRMSLKNNLDEFKKCQLLCDSCHNKKTAKERSGFRHGTYYASMKKKCCCEICIIAKRKFNDIRNATRRKSNRIEKLAARILERRKQQDLSNKHA